MDISKIDLNFNVETRIDRTGLVFMNAEDEPFRIYGISREGDRFRRLPEEIARTVSAGVHALHANTAGGRVRFRTDSTVVAISAKVANVARLSHFALTAIAGFDLYENIDGKEVFLKTFRPPYGIEKGFESILALRGDGMHDVTINFPLYSDVLSLEIGIEEGSSVEAPTPYVNDKPVVFYGSSITHGACSSRPGTCYEAILSRRFNMDYINMGFSGNCRGEDEIVDYMASLDMHAFVLDYDHNAGTPEHLLATHEKAYRKMRAKHPDMPILIMSRPNSILIPVAERCLHIIRSTYLHALEAGDRNVYLLTGRELTAMCGNDGTVDNTHPTDFGFQSMAKAVGDLFEREGIF